MPMQSYKRCARTSKIDLKSITYRVSFLRPTLGRFLTLQEYPHTVYRTVSACLWQSKTLKNAIYILQKSAFWEIPKIQERKLIFRETCISKEREARFYWDSCWDSWKEYRNHFGKVLRKLTPSKHLGRSWTYSWESRQHFRAAWRILRIPSEHLGMSLELLRIA